jgi:hypothetical protein
VLLRRSPEPGARAPFLEELARTLPETGPAAALGQALLAYWQERRPPVVGRLLCEIIAPGPTEDLAEMTTVVLGLLAAAGVEGRPLTAPEAAAWVRLLLEPGAAPDPETLAQGLPPQPEPAVCAPAALELLPDGARYPDGTVLLPLTLREEWTAGDPARPLRRLDPGLLGDGLGETPAWVAVVLRREAPQPAARKLRAERTLTEGVLQALAEKLGRSWSTADLHRREALDQAESAVALGLPPFRVELLWAFWGSEAEARAARREVEGRLRAAGILPQTFQHIADRFFRRAQPGGGLQGAVTVLQTLLPETVGLLPPPPPRPRVPRAAVILGTDPRRGHDVYWSFVEGVDPTLPAPAHGLLLVLGEMGAGKTTLLRSLVLQRWLQGRTVVTLDPEGENTGLCRALGGLVLPARPPEDPTLCLCHPLQGDDPEEVLLSARFLLSALLQGEMVEDVAGLSALHGAVKLLCGRARAPDSTGYRLSLGALREALLAQGARDRRAGLLGTILEPYAAGGILDGFFDRPRAVITGRLPAGVWVNVDLSGLREETRTPVYAALVWLFHRAVVGERQVGLDLVVDEGWRLLRPGPFRGLLDELARRARKRGVGIVLATHLPQDVGTGTALDLFAGALIGRLGKETVRTFLQAAGMDPERAEMLAGLAAGLPRFTFLLVPGASLGMGLPVRVELPPAWLEVFAGHDPYRRRERS